MFKKYQGFNVLDASILTLIEMRTVDALKCLIQSSVV